MAARSSGLVNTQKRTDAEPTNAREAKSAIGENTHAIIEERIGHIAVAVAGKGRIGKQKIT